MVYITEDKVLRKVSKKTVHKDFKENGYKVIFTQSNFSKFTDEQILKNIIKNAITQ